MIPPSLSPFHALSLTFFSSSFFSLSLSSLTQSQTKLDFLFCFRHELIMSINFSMGFSCGDDFVFDKKEKEVALIDERQSRETTQRGVSVMEHTELLELDFWPVEHPSEPQDEDRPVKCPMPSASSVINDSRMQEESFRKRAEVPVEINREGIDVNIEPPVRAVRKRHHTLTNDDHNTDTIQPLMRMPPVPPPQVQTPENHLLQNASGF